MNGQTKCGISIQWSITLEMKKIVTHATTGMNLEDILLSETDQSERDK